jgi:hypothetical protein
MTSCPTGGCAHLCSMRAIRRAVWARRHGVLALGVLVDRDGVEPFIARRPKNAMGASTHVAVAGGRTA